MLMATSESKNSPDRYSFGVLFGKLASFVSLVILCIVLSILSPYFLTVENLFAIGLQISVIAIMAVGQMMIIISAGIDLSVGSLLALSGVVCTSLVVAGYPLFISVLSGIMIATLCGTFNGFVIAKGRIPPFIATLGMMGIARGIALVISGGAGIQLIAIPEAYAFIGGGRVFGVVPVPVIITLIVVLIGFSIVRYTRMGLYTYAIGSNAEAARLSGVNVKKYLILIYTFCGMLCGSAGVMLSSRMRSGQPTAGTGWELDVIAACVIGGASLSGGEGRIFGAVVGALIMGVLRNGSNLLDISAFWQQIAIGAIIIVAVFIDQYKHAHRQ